MSLAAPVFVAFAALAAFTASVDAGDCMSPQGVRCLPAEENAGLAHHYKTGNPCFEMGGNNWCFINTKGNMHSCDCSNPDCGCGKPPPDPCTNEGISTPDCTADKNKYCDAKYDWRGAKNTLCQFCGIDTSTCGNKVCKKGLDSAAQKAIVDAHNTLRRKVAKGQESRGAPGPQPPAKDMLELVWDDELAKSAQMWADQCSVTPHDKAPIVEPWLEFPGVGQNRLDAGGSAFNANPNWNYMVTKWYDEVIDYPADKAGEYTNTAPKVTGHYTQLVWAKSAKVGCGFISYKVGSTFKYLLVCNYGPGGNGSFNNKGLPLYTVGATASDAATACPTGTTANDGLCKQG